MEFEWDSRKAAGNLRKHRVTFQEASTVFGDVLSTTVSDPDHSHEEHRFITIGQSNRMRVLIVAHAQRAERVRIISARTLTRKEQKDYETNQENSI